MSVTFDSAKVVTMNPVEIDKRIRLIFNKNLTENQLSKGIVAKCQVLHPAFSTRVTIFSNKGVLTVNGASLKTGEGNTSKDYFNIVLMEPAFRAWIINEYKNHEAGQDSFTSQAWYNGVVGNAGPVVTIGKENPELDITDIQVVNNLSAKQTDAGIACKVSLKTPGVTLRGISVFQSRFGQSLYLSEQAEDQEGQIPAYKLTREGEAQVLAFVHSLILEWGPAPEPRKRATAEQVIENAVGTAGVQTAAVTEVNEDEYFGAEENK